MKSEIERICECHLFEVLNILVLKGNQPRDLWDRTVFWNAWEKLPTSWSYPKDCQEFKRVPRFPVEEVPRRNG